MNMTQAIGRMREVIRRQHKALSTQDSCVFWLRRYMTALRQMPKDLSSEKKLEGVQQNVMFPPDAHQHSAEYTRLRRKQIPSSFIQVLVA